MYYLAFFIDYHPFFKKKLKTWLHHHRKHTIISFNDQQKYKLKSINNLFDYSKNSHRYDQTWYIHGQNLSQSCVSGCPELPIRTQFQFPKISLEKINTTLIWFATNYQWSILPWGGEPRFQSFLFISREHTLRDQFVESSTNIMDIPLEKFSRKTSLCNLLIATYNVHADFGQIIKGIVFEENLDTVGEIWDACECEISPPWLITDLLFDENSFSIFSWYPAKYKVIQPLTAIKNFYSLGVYQPCDKISFESMCRLVDNDPSVFIWIPQNTDLAKFQHLLLSSEDRTISYSDLSYLQNFLAITKWLYGFRRDWSYEHYSMFIARNSTLLQEVDIFRQDSYRLLACF